MLSLKTPLCSLGIGLLMASHLWAADPNPNSACLNNGGNATGQFRVFQKLAGSSLPAPREPEPVTTVGPVGVARPTAVQPMAAAGNRNNHQAGHAGRIPTTIVESSVATIQLANAVAPVVEEPPPIEPPANTRRIIPAEVSRRAADGGLLDRVLATKDDSKNVICDKSNAVETEVESQPFEELMDSGRDAWDVSTRRNQGPISQVSYEVPVAPSPSKNATASLDEEHNPQYATTFWLQTGALGEAPVDPAHALPDPEPSSAPKSPQKFEIKNRLSDVEELPPPRDKPLEVAKALPKPNPVKRNEDATLWRQTASFGEPEVRRAHADAAFWTQPAFVDSTNTATLIPANLPDVSESPMEKSLNAEPQQVLAPEIVLEPVQKFAPTPDSELRLESPALLVEVAQETLAPMPSDEAEFMNDDTSDSTPGTWATMPMPGGDLVTKAEVPKPQPVQKKSWAGLFVEDVDQLRASESSLTKVAFDQPITDSTVPGDFMLAQADTPSRATDGRKSGRMRLWFLEDPSDAPKSSRTNNAIRSILGDVEDSDGEAKSLLDDLGEDMEGMSWEERYPFAFKDDIKPKPIKRVPRNYPPTMGDIVSDSESTDLIVEKAFGDMMWSCSGGKCMNSFDRMRREMRRNYALFHSPCGTEMCRPASDFEQALELQRQQQKQQNQQAAPPVAPY